MKNHNKNTYTLIQAREKIIRDRIFENNGISLDQDQYKYFASKGLTRNQVDLVIELMMVGEVIEITIEDNTVWIKPKKEKSI
ncbi:hypothetical protein ACFL6P_03255 [Candidatus Latescibacterota bacterium]